MSHPRGVSATSCEWEDCGRSSSLVAQLRVSQFSPLTHYHTHTHFTRPLLDLRLSLEIESLVENNIGGEKFDEFESIEKNLPYRTLSNTFERIDFCVKDTTTFQKLDSDEIVEKFIIRPIKENNLISMIIKNNKLGEDEIALMVYSRIVKQFASLFYTTILEKKIGTWGAMLAQKYLRSVMGAVLGEWDVGEMR